MNNNSKPIFLDSDGKPVSPWEIYRDIVKQKTDKPYIRIVSCKVYPVNKKAVDDVAKIYEVIDALELSKKICIYQPKHGAPSIIIIDGKKFDEGWSFEHMVRILAGKYSKNINREEKCDYPDKCEVHVYQSDVYRRIGSVDNSRLKTKDITAEEWSKLSHGGKFKHFWNVILSPNDELMECKYSIVKLTIPDEWWDNLTEIPDSFWYRYVFTEEQKTRYLKKFNYNPEEYEKYMEEIYSDDDDF